MFNLLGLTQLWHERGSNSRHPVNEVNDQPMSYRHRCRDKISGLILSYHFELAMLKYEGITPIAISKCGDITPNSCSECCALNRRFLNSSQSFYRNSQFYSYFIYFLEMMELTDCIQTHQPRLKSPSRKFYRYYNFICKHIQPVNTCISLSPAYGVDVS